MKIVPRILLFCVTWLSVLCLTACHRSGTSDELKRHLKSLCDVSFRRGDALGANGALPVPPLSDSLNGADLTMTGVLVAVEPHAIVLRDEPKKRDHWIPLNAILRVSFHIEP